MRRKRRGGPSPKEIDPPPPGSITDKRIRTGEADDGASKRLRADSKSSSYVGMASVIDWPGMLDLEESRAYETLEALERRHDISEFKELAETQIGILWRSTRRSGPVHVAASYLRNLILGGGIKITTGSDNASEENDPSDRLYQQRSAIWTSFASEVLHSRWEVGFAAVVWNTNPVFGGVPVCLDLSQFDIYHTLSAFGRHHYLYRKRGPLLKGMDGAGPIRRMMDTDSFGLKGRGFLPGVMTFTEEGMGPDNWGVIHSIASLCLQGSEDRVMRYRLRTTAEIASVFPTYVTEASESAFNEDNASRALIDRRFEMAENIMNQQGRMIAHLRSRVTPELGPRADTEDGRMGTRHDMQQRAMLREVAARECPRVDLPAGRRLSTTLPCKGPDGIDTMISMHADTVCEYFGISAAVIRPAAMGTHASAALAAERINDMTQRTQKEALLAILQEVMHAIHDGDALFNYILKKPPGAPFDKKEIKKALDVNIMIPGIPQTALTLDCYEKGLLKPEAFQRFLVAHHGFQPEDFNKVPKPPPLVYIPPQPAAAAAAAPAKPKAKPKEKAAAGTKAPAAPTVTKKGSESRTKKAQPKTSSPQTRA